jgi:hypothetical protein
MSSTKDSWDNVGSSWRDFGRRLQERYREERDRSGTSPAPRNLSAQLGEAARSLKAVAQDPEVTTHLDRAVRATGSAISTTVDEVADEIRTQMGKKTDDASSSPAAETPAASKADTELPKSNGGAPKPETPKTDGPPTPDIG